MRRKQQAVGVAREAPELCLADRISSFDPLRQHAGLFIEYFPCGLFYSAFESIQVPRQHREWA